MNRGVCRRAPPFTRYRPPAGTRRRHSLGPSLPLRKLRQNPLGESLPLGSLRQNAQGQSLPLRRLRQNAQGESLPLGRLRQNAQGRSLPLGSRITLSCRIRVAMFVLALVQRAGAPMIRSGLVRRPYGPALR